MAPSVTVKLNHLLSPCKAKVKLVLMFQGEIFIWNLRTGHLVGILADHEGKYTITLTHCPAQHLNPLSCV